MNSTNALKVAVAFLAGLVVALGGALIYVKSTSPAAVPAPASAQTVAQAAPPPAAPARVDPPAAQPTTESAQPVQKEEPAVHKEAVAPKKHKVRRQPSEEEAAAAPTPKPSDPAPVAQNVMPPAPVAAPDPQPQQAKAPPPTPPPPPPQPQTVTLQPGTNLVVRLDETLSTDHNYPGDTFRATLESPIIRNGYVIADRGSKVLGHIVDAEKAGRVKGVSEITLALTAINTTDGQRVQIQTNTTDVKGPESKKRDAAEIAGGSALGAIIGAIAGGGKGAAIGAGTGGAAGTGGVLLTRGKPAVIQAETQLRFQLNAPVTITEKLNQ